MGKKHTIDEVLLKFHTDKVFTYISHLRITTLITKQSGHNFLCIRINAPQVFWLVDKV